MSEVALVSAAKLALSGSNVTLAVFLSKSTLALVTPGTLSSAFFTVMGTNCTAHILHIESDGFQGPSKHGDGGCDEGT